jgi:glycosyltransferase involved in cell wall biosynthesis
MDNKKAVRILHVVSSLNAGGMENYIMNLYRCMDREQIQFDFMVHHKARGLFEDEIERMGGKVYHFSVLDTKNLIKYRIELSDFFDEHREYRILHGHLSSLAVFYLGAAKEHNVPWRIVHSHGGGFLHTPKGVAKYLLFRTAKWNSNIRLACSTEAGKYLFGKDTFEFVPNGVEVNRFAFQLEKRNEMRKKLNLEQNYVIGHVGRFNLQKNHKYLLKIFKEVLAKCPRARLLLLGDGELLDEIKKLAEEMGLRNAMIFAGVHKDVESYYQAMDAFVLPSLFEGLPVTGIEAQYSGLPCFFSDKITREVAICHDVSFLMISDENLHCWVDAIVNTKAKLDRSHLAITTTMFDAQASAVAMAQRYLELWRRN